MSRRPPYADIRRVLIASLVALLLAVPIALSREAAVGAVSSSSPNPFAGRTLYVNRSADPNSRLANQAFVALKSLTSNTNNYNATSYIAYRPQVEWLVNNPQVSPATDARYVAADTVSYLNAAASAQAYPVFALYAIPGRDCGLHSAGGFSSASDYLAWVDSFANAIGSNGAAVILEPDALTIPPIVDDKDYSKHIGGCQSMTTGDIQQRYVTLRAAVDKLTARPNLAVYIDAGNASWWWWSSASQIPAGMTGEQARAAEVAKRLSWAGVQKTRGFAVNVANFQTTAASVQYGQLINSYLQKTYDVSPSTLNRVSNTLIGNRDFVIDTSRNGKGPDTSNDNTSHWCNPWNVALGSAPTVSTGQSWVDAYLWVKHPGESDGAGSGECHGGTVSGTWYQASATAMYNNWVNLPK